jgi:broad specificity phosphatase PhoE
MAHVTHTSTEPPSVYLIRHGETAWSLSGQHTGRTDLPLTAHGRAESRALGERLRATAFAHVFTSPLERARQTCELVGLGSAMEVEADLTEWDYGDYEGRRLIDIRQDRPDWSLFRDGCPNGEMPSQVSGRADRLIARLRALRGTSAVCSHGHFGRVLAARWIGLPVEEARHFLLGTASLSVLGYEHHRANEPAIVAWNAAAT